MLGPLDLAERPLALLPKFALALASGDAVGGRRQRPYVVDDGVAVLGVQGTFANRAHDWPGASYEELRSALDAALGDPECAAVLLDVDSPGGDAAGAMETSAFIRKASARKPIVAFVDGMAASAGYALASGALDIVATPSATLGSIGVVVLHWDISKFLAGIGLKPTLLRCGAFKADGWPTHPLDKGAAARIQRMLDAHYGHFVATVGGHRRALGEAGARRTEAGLFVGQEAVSAGLADALGAKADALALARKRAGRTTSAPSRSSIARSPAPPIETETSSMTHHLSLSPASSLFQPLSDNGTGQSERVAAAPEPGLAGAVPIFRQTAMDTEAYERGRAAFARALGKTASEDARAPQRGLAGVVSTLNQSAWDADAYERGRQAMACALGRTLS